MPKIITVKAGAKATLTGVVDGTVKVNAFSANGSMGTAYEKDTAAATDKYALTEGGRIYTTYSCRRRYLHRYV